MIAQRRMLLLLMASVACVSCDEMAPPIAAYQHWDDRFLAATAGVFGHPCEDKKKGVWDDPTFSMKPMDQCYRFDPPKRFRGLWSNEFESSFFCPSADKRCDVNKPGHGDEIWLDAERIKPSIIEPDQQGVYQVDFVGRKTMFKGGYGHGGISDHYVIADRIVGLKKVSELKQE